MNRSKGVNRLFLAMILLSVISPIVLQDFFLMLDLYQSLAVSQLIFLLPVLIYLALGKGEMLGELQIRWLGVSEVLMVLLLGVLLLPVVTWINLISMLFVTNYVSSAFSEVQTASLGMNFIYMALLPALSEEFMFRGVFFHGYRRAGILKAALCSGLCFGLIHLNLNQFCYAFIVGTIMALVVEATGSLFSSMLVHMVINSSSVLALELASRIELSTELTQELPQMTEEMEAMAQFISRGAMAMSYVFYTILAAGFGTLAFLVIRWLAGHSGRWEHMKQVFRGAAAEEEMDIPEVVLQPEISGDREGYFYEEESDDWQYKEERQEPEVPVRPSLKKSKKRRIFTPCLFIAIVICIGYMTVLEFIL